MELAAKSGDDSEGAGKVEGFDVGLVASSGLVWGVDKGNKV